MLDGYLMAGLLAGVTVAAVAACRACVRAERAAEDARYHVGTAARLADLAERAQTACANYVLEAAGFANDAMEHATTAVESGAKWDDARNRATPVVENLMRRLADRNRERSAAPDVVPFPAAADERPTLVAEDDTDDWDVDPVPTETGNPVA